MKGYLLYTHTSSDRIDVFHYCMFHGETRRRGFSATGDCSHYLDGSSDDPLLVTRNVHAMPDVFRASSSLGVSQRVRKKLEIYPHVRFLELEFEKLVDFPYKAGDYSYYQRKAFRADPRKEDPETLLERLPNVPEFRSTLGNYYELVLARLWKVKGAYLPLRPVVFKVIDLGEEKDEIIELSGELLKDYPMMHTGPGIVFAEEPFKALANHIDWDYFDWSMAEI